MNRKHSTIINSFSKAIHRNPTAYVIEGVGVLVKSFTRKQVIQELDICRPSDTVHMINRSRPTFWSGVQPVVQRQKHKVYAYIGSCGEHINTHT